ncbi:hypothetical protein [Flectobacillus major]|jgi:hypothetical protein|uniref:hypothetical protein n=1 Tax=Flectobacillus major TaxID=103 RepID=UPI0004160736|nr:hypothetical protein [Flectobacillus major]
MRKLIFTSILSLIISFSYESLAIGFPHNLLAVKKTEKKEVKAKDNKTQTAVNLSKKAISLKDSRLLKMSGLLICFMLRKEEE